MPYKEYNINIICFFKHFYSYINGIYMLYIALKELYWRTRRLKDKKTKNIKVESYFHILYF